MRRTLLLPVVVCLTIAVMDGVARSEEEILSADQIVEHYLQAMGGHEGLASIRDRTLKGSFTVFDMAGIVEWHEKVPNKMHQLYDVGTTGLEVWFDGEQGYRIDPSWGPSPFSDEEVEDARSNYVIAPLLRYKERGVTARYVGIERIDDREAHVVEFTDASGKVSTRYFDTSNYYLIRQVSPLARWEGIGNREILFSDYREVGRVKFPFKLTRIDPEFTIEIIVESIEVNTGLDDSIFRHSPQ